MTDIIEYARARAICFWENGDAGDYPMLGKYGTGAQFADAVLDHERVMFSFRRTNLGYANENAWPDMFDTFEEYLFFLLRHSPIADTWVPTDGTPQG